MAQVAVPFELALQYTTATLREERRSSGIVDNTPHQWRELADAGYCIFESPRAEPLESVAQRFGPTMPSKQGGAVVDVLIPRHRETARPGTLSFAYGTDAFPFHTETAHWSEPVDLVLLRCVNPGIGNRATHLIDGWDMGLGNADLAQLAGSLMVVKSRNRSFLSPLAVRLGHRTDFRYDPSCMKPATVSDQAALETLEQALNATAPLTVSWQAGQCLLFDNLRMLHSRGHSHLADQDRRLERIYIAKNRS